MLALNFSSKKQTKKFTGVRPIDVHRDARQVVPLLEKVFHQSLRGQGQRALSPSIDFRWPWQPKPPVSGFVYLREGRVFGNVSLMVSRVPTRYLVANVAVDPDMRRQGIAHEMMKAVIKYVHQRQGDKIVLQVEERNGGARDLYAQLGFTEVGTIEQWQVGYSSLQPIKTLQPVSARRPDRYELFSLQPLRQEYAREAYRLDVALHPAELNWPDPPKPDYYQRGLTQWWTDLLEGRQKEVWTAVSHDKKLVGMAVLETDWGRPYRLRMRTLPEWQSLIARPLMAKIVRRLQYQARRPLQVNHLKEDTAVLNLFDLAGMRRQRTLVTMRLNLKKS